MEARRAGRPRLALQLAEVGHELFKEGVVGIVGCLRNVLVGAFRRDDGDAAADDVLEDSRAVAEKHDDSPVAVAVVPLCVEGVGHDERERDHPDGEETPPPHVDGGFSAWAAWPSFATRAFAAGASDAALTAAAVRLTCAARSALTARATLASLRPFGLLARLTGFPGFAVHDQICQRLMTRSAVEANATQQSVHG